MGWLLNQSPGAHVENAERRPVLARTSQEHDPHSESEASTKAVVEGQVTRISPVRAPPPTGLVVQPGWEDADAEHWAIQRVIQTSEQRKNAATILRTHQVAGLGPKPSYPQG